MSEKRLAVVTGAARGIGKAIVFELLKQGRLVAGLDIIEDQLKELEETVKKDGFEVITRCVDITDTEKFTEVLATQEADERAWRILKPLDHVFPILDKSLGDPGGDIMHEIPIAPEKIGDDEPAKRQPLGQDRSHQVRQKDGTG